MAAESSPFESSEILASFPSSTPFLEESWRLCSLANSSTPRSFVVDQQGEVGYLAFSGVQVIDVSSCGTLVALGESECEQLFWPLRCGGDDEGTVKVDAGFLRLFREFYQRQDLQTRIEEFLGKVKTIILTGHSFGATTASLTTLWLLSHLRRRPIASPISVLCLTFGTPLLGNESLSRAILRERWGGRFCNVVSKLDVVPKLFFAPLTSWTPQLHLLLQFWQVTMASPSPEQLVQELRKQNFDEFFSSIKKSVEDAARSKKGARKILFWPLGSYLFCSKEGLICLDNAASVVKMMHLMLETVSPNHSFEDHLMCFEDHLKYGYYTEQRSLQLLKRININNLSESSNEAGVFLALRSSRIDPEDNNISKPAKDCQQMAWHMGRARILNIARLAIRQSMIIPCKALLKSCEVELKRYKAHCDKSVDQLGYYDTFKNAGAYSWEFIIDMNLFKLGAFWDNVIHVVEQNEQQSHYFHHRSKWNCLSRLYRLLAEPLEIARYYCDGMHKEKGHYIKHGRNRRFQILERWWDEKVAVAAQEPRQNKMIRRSGRTPRLTQDSLFWARVEEAKEWLEIAEKEEDPNKLEPFLVKMNGFEKYAGELIVREEVSIDVLAKNSSYKLWAEKWEAFKSKLRHRSEAFDSHELLAEPSEIARNHRHGMDNEHNLHRNLEDHQNINGLSESSNEAGDCLALQSSGIDPQFQNIAQSRDFSNEIQPLHNGMNQTTRTEEPTETPGESHEVLSSAIEPVEPTSEIIRVDDEAGGISTETEESSRESNSEAVLLALNATSLGCVSTAFFGVNRNIYLDWLGMAYIISLALAVFLVMFGKCSQHKEMMAWGNHFTRATIVLTVAIVIAAAVLGKRKR